jgi:uncharacterized membrane-anchored protein YjiN (DUF445 family)
MKSFDEIFELQKRDDETFEELINDFIEDYYQILEFEEIYIKRKLQESVEIEQISTSDILMFFDINIARIKNAKDRLFKQLLERKRKFSSEKEKQKFIRFIKDTDKDTDKDIKKDEDIKKKMKERKDIRDSLVNMMLTYKVITEEDLK